MATGRLIRGDAWKRLVNEVNGGVFPGTGEAFHEDALTFLGRVSGDIVYIDPPYAATTSYQREYAVLDELLGDEVRPVSRFTRSPDAVGAQYSSGPLRQPPTRIHDVTRRALDAP